MRGRLACLRWSENVDNGVKDLSKSGEGLLAHSRSLATKDSSEGGYVSPLAVMLASRKRSPRALFCLEACAHLIQQRLQSGHPLT